MLEVVLVIYARGISGADLRTLSEDEKIRVLPGAPVGGKHTEVRVDHAVKRYLRKARRHV